MKLKILATSDMHGYIMPTNFTERTINMPFGTAKVASKIKSLEASFSGPIVKIENGDFIQGSPLSYYVKKSEAHQVGELTQAINELQYDVSVLGNHEFNYGLSYLKQAIASYNHPVICANILDEEGRPAFGNPYVILEKQGIKIAILGLTTQYIPHWEQPQTVKNLTFVSAIDTAKKYVPKLRELADLVIVSYHGGFEKDLQSGEPTELLTGENEAYDLLHQVLGIDALVTGHQHRQIATKINGVPVIQPGYQGAFLGEICLELEQKDHWKVVDSQATLYSVAEEKVDPMIDQTFAPLNEEVENWLDQPVGKVEGDMSIKNPEKARLVEHPYIEFINKVQMDAAGVDISGTALFNNEGKGFKEIITMRDILTNYIYPNTLAVLKLTGADLKAALEQSANHFILEKGQINFNPKYIEPKPQYYNYDMYEGIDYTVDLTQKKGQQIISLTYHDQPVLETDTFEVVMNQYRAVGGGNYTMFTPEKIVREIQIDMTELIAEYLRKHPVIKAETNQNFRFLKKTEQ